MSKSKSDLLVENVVGFPNNRIYYTREEVPMNQKVYNYMESSTPEKSNEELFDNESSKLTRLEWETVITLKELEYLIIIRGSNERKRPPHLKNSKSALKVLGNVRNGSPKRKRSAPLKSEGHQCPNCLTTDSALWRNCVIKGKSHHLCNACGLRFKKGKFCPICYKVYYDVDTNPQEWRQCNMCYNWTHRKCLAEEGYHEVEGSYTCILCQKQDESNL